VREVQSHDGPEEGSAEETCTRLFGAAAVDSFAFPFPFLEGAPFCGFVWDAGLWGRGISCGWRKLDAAIWWKEKSLSALTLQTNNTKRRAEVLNKQNKPSNNIQV
jgi:hypothetical protein